MMYCLTIKGINWDDGREHLISSIIEEMDRYPVFFGNNDTDGILYFGREYIPFNKNITFRTGGENVIPVPRKEMALLSKRFPDLTFRLLVFNSMNHKPWFEFWKNGEWSWCGAEINQYGQWKEADRA